MRILTVLCLLLPCFLSWGQDYIIFKNGDIRGGKVDKVTATEAIAQLDRATPLSKNILLKSMFKMDKEVVSFPLSDIYMIKFKERGNVYYLPDNVRKTEEKAKLDKSANLIYLIEGKEIPAWGISIDNGKLAYRKTKDKKMAPSNDCVLDLQDVFMIYYSDGTSDILTDLSKKEEPAPEPEPKEEEPQFKVIFHSVKLGETLAAVAKLYEVTPDDIRGWNELPATVKDTSRLKKGLQLMIQQPIKP